LGDAYYESGARFEALRADGVGLFAADPSRRTDGAEPLLVVNRRGEISVVVAKPDAPSDSFHGRGTARGRGGEEGPRIREVTRLRLLTGDTPATGPGRGAGGGGGGRTRGKAASAGAPPEGGAMSGSGERAGGPSGPGSVETLEILVDGEVVAQWSKADMEAFPSLRGGQGSAGKPFDAWSIDTVASRSLGANVVLAGVRDRDGEVRAIAPEELDLSKQIPVLRVNRRNMWRFQFIEPDGSLVDDSGVRQVTALLFERKQPPGDAR
jgi:hypothetical protein